MIPSLPSTKKSGSEKVSYEIMPSVRKVMEYSNLNYHEALSLPCDVFRLMVKNHTVDELSKTEEGREYLAKCERLNTTSIDLDKLQQRYRKE